MFYMVADLGTLNLYVQALTRIVLTLLQAGNTPAQYSSYASVKALLQSATEAKVEPKPSSTQAVVPALQVVMPPELPTSSSGAASQPAPNKAEKVCMTAI